ncbi:MAG: 2,3-bisphosphoglycerate-independent phosphoglycerate mutase [Calditerrivibrio sp.]|uniref:2,3-bisphosphoglycerate-independent phosphoglycerate mutase n=1 Tax=Calditerrivibrio sp. TaxID=2792612 RepID=UPI003D108711
MKKVVLLILDGWGYREEKEHNAVLLSNPQNFLKLWNESPKRLINASEEFVGLPSGQMGNSEVGHTNIGAGRIVYQDLVRIQKAIQSKEINNNKTLQTFFENIKKYNGSLHLFGLLSDGGVHSHIDHLKGLINIAKEAGIGKTFIHAFMDGRDTPPTSGKGFLEDLLNFLKSINYGTIATVIGRYYAMDRDKRWDRVEKAYNAIVFSKGENYTSPIEACEVSYKNNITDEFITPKVIGNYDGIKDGDGILFFNFRADRARELTRAFIETDFNFFETRKFSNLPFVTMTEYDATFKLPYLFAPEDLKNTLGEYLSNLKLTQLRIAETEKYAHVTFFFNGGREIEFGGESRILIPSPKDVPTYDLKPEMSVEKVVDNFIDSWKKHKFDLTVMNFANPDMVGHTGVEEAAINACKKVDEQLGRVVQFAKENDLALIVTADHGNSEEMWDYKTNQPHTAHTTNPVPFIIFNYNCEIDSAVKDGKLADIAPTILTIMDLPIPPEMTGVPLIKRKN